MLILLCIWPFNFCHIAVKLLLWFQRVGHLVHCGEQSGPTCKIPARQVLRQELLHHSECKHLPTNCPHQMWCEIVQLILDLLCLISLHTFCNFSDSWAENRGSPPLRALLGWGGGKRGVCSAASTFMVPQIMIIAWLCFFLLMASFVSSALHIVVVVT